MSTALQTHDLGPGYSMQLMPGGDQVVDQVTLDNCGFRFTTEAYRVARRQYVAVNAHSANTGLSNELVAYDTSAHAAKAVTEWHTAAATCPRTPVHPRVAGEPDLLIRVGLDDTDVATVPVKPNAVTAETATVMGKGTLHNITILQVRGRYLDAPCTSRRALPSQRRSHAR